MKEFDYEKAKAGAPVCTRNGRKVRIVCWDAKGNYPIVALAENNRGSEVVMTYTKDGRYCVSEDSMEDLVMALVKTEGWVNIYKRLDGSIKIGGYNATKAEATTERTLSLLDYGYIATIKIEWEE